MIFNSMVALDLLAVAFSIYIFKLTFEFKPNFKKLMGPIFGVFYVVAALAIALALLELFAILPVEENISNLILHFLIISIMVAIVVSFNRAEKKILEVKLAESLEVTRMKMEFLARTSHELKTPITPLLMQLQMLQKGLFGPLNEKQGKSVEMIERNIKRLGNLITDILYYSKTCSGKIQLYIADTDLNEMASLAIKTMQNNAEKKSISISFRRGNLPLISCDQDKIVEILENLLDNAIKFSSNGGNIVVESWIEEKSVLISVKDSGIGISSEEMQLLFIPFTQFSDVSCRPDGGTGIGLSICKSIVELHNGKIWAESAGKGKGTTFFMSLPLKK